MTCIVLFFYMTRLIQVTMCEIQWVTGGPILTSNDIIAGNGRILSLNEYLSKKLN